jgi:hypothetical protein
MLMVMLITSIIVGTAAVLLRFGIAVMLSNMAYLTAWRGALSSVELMSREIPAAERVEIISDDAHDIEAGLEKDWSYVVLSDGSKEVRSIYKKEDGARVEEKVPGSEYIEDISFDAKAIQGGGGRLLQVHIKAAYGAADNRKTMDLGKTMLVHAADGIRGENGAEAPVSGRILRYMLRVARQDLDVYGSTNTGVISDPSGPDIFNYSNPKTWEGLEPCEDYTYVDARLTLTLKTRKEADIFETFAATPDGTVSFMWIVADGTSDFVNDIVESDDAKRNPKAILNYLKDHARADYWQKEPGWNILKDKYPIATYPRASNEMPHGFIRYEDGGFNLLDVTGGEIETKARRVYVDWKYSLDFAAREYKGDYLIVVARFRDSAGSDRTELPVYVKLGKKKKKSNEPNFLQDMITELENGQAVTSTNDRTFEHSSGGSGVTIITDPVTNRRYFQVSPGSDAVAPLVLAKFVSGDFAHMIPEGATTVEFADKIFYGPTNYAVYLDVRISNMQGGGYGLLLNGSKVRKSDSTSAGYLWNISSNTGSLIFRYYGYKSNNGYAEDDVDEWGARPMYFYDAPKKLDAGGGKFKFSAPGEVRFFNKNREIEAEDFSENAGANGEALWYRLPFASTTRAYISQISISTESRNDRYILNDFYGTTSGIDSTRRAVYAPKYMQSWHMYGDTNPVDMGGANANNDIRTGFRWDRSWHLAGGNDNNQSTWQRKLWEQRTVFKFTVLEATRNITADEVEPEWRYKIHHSNVNPVTGGGAQLTSTDEKEVIHREGDLFVRLELIRLKQGKEDWSDSRNYVYSKPVWYGKFKGDAWRGDDPSPFKKLGNTMQHLVADAEPPYGDAQSFRRRGMRVRSWKEAFLGWNFSKLSEDIDGRHSYKWEQSTDSLPPDFFETVYKEYDKNNPDPKDFGRVDASPGKTGTAHSVWTPPTAIDMNNAPADADKVLQSGDLTANTFGQYFYADHYVERERRDDDETDTAYYYNGKYTDRVYGRLSFLRPWRGGENSQLPNHTVPIFGLYAMRGWDFGTSYWKDQVYDSAGNTNESKRFLRVVQGLQLPYHPAGHSLNRGPNADNGYASERERTLGLRVWGSNRIDFYDGWIGEGFTPREVRAILGLRKRNPGESENDYIRFIRGAYVYSTAEKNNNIEPGESALEGQGFYMPMPEAEEDE